MDGKWDVVVVGSGFYGATIAERCATELGLRVLVVEKRAHIGGNSFSESDRTTGIEVHTYGSHLFHTSSDTVWDYVRRFTTFNNYRHRVIVRHADKFYTMPINLGTMSSFFGRFLSPAEARAIIAAEISEAGLGAPANLEEKAISLVGRSLYEAFIRSYTAKQWQTDPRELPASIITRLPVRMTFDDYYFQDRYEGVPTDGYGAIFERMLRHENILVATGCDFFMLRDSLPPGCLLVYTGAIDHYYGYRAGRLGWRTLDFQSEVIDTSDFQGAAVVNYPDEQYPFTRIHEFRHLHPERAYDPQRTVIFREFSRSATDRDEPYYPVNTEQDKAVLNVYREWADRERDVIFGGRLGKYKYIDMHQAIGGALAVYQKQIRPRFVPGDREARLAAPAL